jgi:hypothetical protein
MAQDIGLNLPVENLAKSDIHIIKPFEGRNVAAISLDAAGEATTSRGAWMTSTTSC